MENKVMHLLGGLMMVLQAIRILEKRENVCQFFHVNQVLGVTLGVN